MGSVPVDKAGVGSAVLNSVRQVGGALGIAVMGAIVAACAIERARATCEPARGVRRRLPARAPGRGGRSPLVGALIRSPSRARDAKLRRSTSRAVPSQARRGAIQAVARRGRAPRDAPRRARAGRSPTELPRHDDRRDRPRGRGHRADPLPALRLEARRSTSPAWTELGAACGRSGTQRLAAEPDPGRLAFRDRAGVPSSRRGRAAARLAALGPGARRGERRSARSAAYMRAHLREVHAYVADVIRRSQAAGGIVAGARSGRRGLDLPRDRAPGRHRPTEVVGALLPGSPGPRSAAEPDRWLRGPLQPAGTPPS